MTATLRFDIVGNGSQGRRELASTRNELDRYGRSAQSLGRYADASSSRVSRLGSALGKAARFAGAALAVGVAAAGAAVVRLGVDSFRAASDVEQSFGGIDSVFKKNADTVKRWAAGAADSVGLAKSQYASLASTLGASLKNSGIEGYTKATDELIRKGADLAATFGGDVSEAVSAISSLLRGETDPIERYGVSIKQADVNARLLAKGQDKLEGSAKRAAEMQARLDLLMQQTKDTTGQFAREAKTAAGAQQRLTAKWENAKATLGERLLPIGSKLMDWLSGVIDGSNSAGRFVRRMGERMKEVAGWIQSDVVPEVKELTAKVRETSGAFKSGRAATDRWADGLVKGEGASDKLKRALGRPGSTGLLGVITAFEVTLPKAAGYLGMFTGVLESGANAADRLAGRLSGLIGRLNDLRNINLPNVGGSIAGLLRDGEEYPGLARGLGVGATSSGATRIELTSSPDVRIEVDSAALASVFRVVIRDEVSRALAPSGGRVYL